MKHLYSDNVTNKKIIILGPYPPPLGGVSVHIARVQKKFQKQGNEVIIFDTTTELRYKSLVRYIYKLVSFITKYKPDYIYFHTLYLDKSIYEMFALTWLQKKLKFNLVLVEHDCRHIYKRFRIFKWLLNKCMQRVQHLIVIGSKTECSYQDNAIFIPKNYSVEAAFLPPETTKEVKLLESYPAELFYFIEQHQIIIGMNAFQCVLIDGKDLYGLKMTIELIGHLKNENLSVGLVLVISKIGDEIYFNKLQEHIEFHGIRNNVFILGGDTLLWPLFKLMNLFVRPTFSDGESVSVQEALYFNIPVVASDVCIRPKKVVLFESGNQKSFNENVKKVLYVNINQFSHNLHQKQIG